MRQQMRFLVIVLVVQALLATVFIVLVATGNVPFVNDDSHEAEGDAARVANRFDGHAAYRLVEDQVRMGPRPAGSDASRRLAERLRRKLPHGRFQAVPHGLRNVVGKVPGRGRGYVVVGAHYDTKDIPGFVGANDGAGGTAVVTQLAREIKRRRFRRTVVFVLFDGEETPAGVPESQFEERGIRGAKVAAKRYRRARAMILLDFVAQKNLRVPFEQLSDERLWAKLRRAARKAGVGRTFPDDSQGSVLDDHVPFLHEGVPSIDLIDFDFPCWHQTCDDLSVISERSLDATGETVYRLLASL
jgi:glutaminyl-peptide cyclotransferase